MKKEEWKKIVREHIGNFDVLPDGKYWDPTVEKMPREELERLRNKKLRALMQYIYYNSPYYHRKFDQLGLKPDDFKTLEDIKKAPITYKEDFALNQNEKPPFGDFHCITMEEWAKNGFMIESTGGTTAKPRLFMVSLEDKDVWTYLYARTLWAQGIRPGHILFNCSVYGPFPGMWGAHYAAHLLRCPIIPGGGMDSKRRLFFIKEIGATVLIGVPSYIMHLAEEARKLGIDPAKDTKIEHVICMAEPGAAIPSIKRRIQDSWSAIAHDYFGHTEAFMGGILGYSCLDQDLQDSKPVEDHISEDMAIVEVVDPKTLEPVGKEEKGITIVTNLYSISYPVIRYLMGDLMIYTDSPCECGRTFGRAIGGLLGRVDDMLKIRGTVVYPSAIEAVLKTFKEVGNEYEIVVTKVGELDELTVRVEVNNWFPISQWEELRQKIINELMLTLGVRCEVEILKEGSLPRFTRGDLDAKAKRIKDLRPKVYQ